MDNQIKQEIKQDDNWNQVEITAEDIYEDGSDNDLEDDETYEINIELIKNYTYVFYSGILVLKQRILLFFFLINLSQVTRLVKKMRCLNHVLIILIRFRSKINQSLSENDFNHNYSTQIKAEPLEEGEYDEDNLNQHSNNNTWTTIIKKEIEEFKDENNGSDYFIEQW